MTEERLREIEADISKRAWSVLGLIPPMRPGVSPEDAALVRELIDDVRRQNASRNEFRNKYHEAMAILTEFGNIDTANEAAQRLIKRAEEANQ